MTYDLRGRRYGKLTVLEPGEPKNGARRWRCRCDCGAEFSVVTHQLTRRRDGSPAGKTACNRCAFVAGREKSVAAGRNEELIRRFRAGEGGAALARAYAITRTRVYQIIKRFGNGANGEH